VLERAVKQVLSRPEYSWRLPREKREVSLFDELHRYGFIGSALDRVREWIRQVKAWIGELVEWLNEKLFPSRRDSAYQGAGPPGSRMVAMMKVLLVVLTAGIVCLLVLLALQAWRKGRGKSPEIVAEAVPQAPDLHSRDIDPASLSEGVWYDLARQMLEKGELRLALRALYLASLSEAAHRELITAALYKTDREYLAELRRRAYSSPELVDAFTRNVRLYEESWYGTREVSPEVIEQFRADHERVKAHGV